VDIPPSQVNILDGNASDLVAECNAYEERIKAFGGVELFFGGAGADGHIAFNVSPPVRIKVASPNLSSH
jgi:glucosamine-6-phosphate deaminase